MKPIYDTSSRFRILKGGKISLVVSALLVGSSVVGSGLYAQDVITAAQNTPQTYDYSGGGDTDVDLNVTTGSIAVSSTGNQTAVDIIRPYASSYATTITNQGTISAGSTDGGSATAISIKGDSSPSGHTTGDISITNSGTISATTSGGLGVGIYIANHDSLMHILNDTTGTITSSTWGLYFKDSQLLSGSTITNNGSITTNNTYGPSAGILFNNGSAKLYESSITNTGTISATASGVAYGMNLQYFEGSSITNTSAGSISASSTNQSAYGIYARNFYNSIGTDATITNSGLVHAETTYGSDAKGIYIYNNSSTQLNGVITNNAGNGTTTGVISAQADNGKAKGIELYSYSVDGFTLTNSGTISATAGSGGNEAYGIQFRNNNYLNINNTTILNALGAEISATSVNSNAIGIDFYSYSSSAYLNATNITNGGSISATSTYNKAYGIRLFGGYGAYMYASSITNSGTISALTGDNSSAYGIYTGKIYDTSHISNSGTISATAGYNGSATGIYAREMRGSSYISNATGKTISALAGDQGNARAINVGSMNDSSHITNSGTMSAEAGYNATAYALKIGSMGDSSYITNSGMIGATVGYNSTAKGIYVQNLSTTITNNGTISATADHDANAYGLDIGSMSDPSRIINSGTISATADYNSNVNGIHVGNLSADSVISNTSGHTISAEAGNNSDAAGINTGNLYGTSHITNSGTISVTTGSNGTARGIVTGYLRDNAYIKNNSTGTLDISGTNAYGIMASMDTTSTITNQGTISVDGTNSAYGMMINNSVSGATVTNDGTITATISAQADSAAFSLKTQGQININNTSTGNLNGNLSVIGTLTNDGTVRLPYNATNAFVTTLVNNGTLQIGLLTDGTLGGTTHSTLGADDATFNNGSTINVNVLAASTDTDLLIDQTIQDVVAATNSLTINGTLNVTDNSALLNFEYVQDGNTIDLNVVQGTTILDSAIAGGGNSNAQSVASALQAIQDAGSYPEMDSFFSALNGLSSDAEIASAVESTTPAATNASSSATTQIMNGVQGMVEMRQNTMMGTGGMNSGDINLVDKNLWVKLFGSRGSQDKKDGINGFDVKAHGLGIGADAEVSPRQRVGAALFYTDASVDVNNMPQTSDLKVYTALVYGNVPVNTNTDFLYQAGYSWQKTETDRTILPTYDHARADYTSRTASLNLKVMQSYSLRNDLVVHPLVETTYRHYTNPSYSESGAGALNLQVDNFTSTQFVTGGGAIFDYKLDKDSKLSTDLRIGYDWHHNAQTVTSSYQGASGVDFTTSGIDNGGWQYDIGLGYETAKLLDGELEFMYNYQAQGSSFRNNVLSAKYTYKF